MANISTVITITDSGKNSGSGCTASDVTSLTQKPGSPHGAVNRHVNYLMSFASRSRDGKFVSQVQNGDSVAATGTLTFNNAGLANDTLTINGVTFTAKSSGATGNQWNVGADATTSAAAAATAINASTTAGVQHCISASAASGVITITALTLPSNAVLGNGFTIAGGQASITASGAQLTGGANDTGTSNTYDLGL